MTLGTKSTTLATVILSFVMGGLTVGCDDSPKGEDVLTIDAALASDVASADTMPQGDMALPPVVDAAPVPMDAAPQPDMVPPATDQPPGSACGCDAECAPIDGHTGICVRGVCMSEPTSDCSGGDREECPDGHQCWSFEGGVGPFCWPDCEAIDDCVGTCDGDGSCAPSDDTECDAACSTYCGGAVTSGDMGAECEDDDDCGGATCYAADGWVDGYCLNIGCGAAGEACGTGGICVSGLVMDDTVCMDACENTADCRGGYECQGGADGNFCFPGCSAIDPCPAGLVCNDDDLCVIDYTCSPARPDSGECPAGQVCTDGACVAFECSANSPLEPNENQAAAAAVDGPVENLQICQGDHDWYGFTPSQDGWLYTVGQRSEYGSGNLDVTLVDGMGQMRDQGWLLPNGYHDENPRGPMNTEVMSLVGHPDAEAFSLHVRGVNGARNNYTLSHTQTPYRDGADCERAGYTSNQCRALTAGGNVDPAQLIMFPAGHTNDPHIGNGVFFDSGLSNNNTPTYVPSSARWARRELVMAIRHAIHTVQEAYPGTGPLGIGEITMPDGTTPNGHPNHTHDYGGSVDLAYYIREDAQRDWGNLVYRPICSDQARLGDWSRVDTDGSTGHYGECVPGSDQTHIVDIPRTALLFATICETGRVRVFGVDTSISAHLKTEYRRLRDAGTISERAFGICMSAQASADEHASWVWHFNHSHVSFCYGTCPNQKATLTERLRPDYESDLMMSRRLTRHRTYTPDIIPREVDPR